MLHGRTMTAYGPSPARVLVIDGCFICLMNRGLELRFDSQFDFNHYDIDLCMSAYVKEMKVEVLPILCQHSSPGNGFNSPQFIESQKKFCQKWF